jgi:hypothetical protein
VVDTVYDLRLLLRAIVVSSRRSESYRRETVPQRSRNSITSKQLPGRRRISGRETVPPPERHAAAMRTSADTTTGRFIGSAETPIAVLA